MTLPTNPPYPAACPSQEIFVLRTTVAEVGFCNGCRQYREPSHTSVVWNVSLRSMSFRLCLGCRDELMRQLAQKQLEAGL